MNPDKKLWRFQAQAQPSVYVGESNRDYSCSCMLGPLVRTRLDYSWTVSAHPHQVSLSLSHH